MKYLKMLKSSLTSILLAIAGVLSVVVVQLRHAKRAAQDKLKRQKALRQAEREAQQAIIEESEKLEKAKDEIQQDTYNPISSMSRYDK